MTERLTRATPADLEIRGDGRTVHGLAVPYDSPTEVSDGGGRPYTEVFRYGSFARTIAERGPGKVKFLAQHNRTAMPLGRAVSLREDPAGLVGEFRVSKTAAGDEALELIRDGALDAFSVGFQPVKDRQTRDGLERLEVRLLEVSAVSFPAYQGAAIAGVRSAIPCDDVATRRRRLLIARKATPMTTTHDPMSEIHNRIAALETEIQSIASNPNPTAADEERFNAVVAERRNLESEVEMDAVRNRFRTASAPTLRFEDIPSSAIVPGQSVNVNTRTSNPFDADRLRGLAPEKRVIEARAMARDAIESRTRDEHVTDEAREHATRTLERDDDVSRDVAEIIIGTGSDAYRKAFFDHLRAPADLAPRIELEKARNEIEQRAALSLAGTAGALFPYALDPTILLTNSGVVSPIREQCRNVQITGTNEWRNPASAGVSAAVLAEGTEVADNTPTFTSNAIFAWKQAAYMQASWESAGDSGIASSVAMLMADAKDRLEGQLFATGTGSSQPQGLITFASNATSVVAGTSGAANAADLVDADIYGMTSALSPRWRGNAQWFANLAVINSIRRLGTSTNYHAFTLGLEAGGPPQLLGKKLNEVSDFDSTVVSGSSDFVLAYGDPSTFVVLDRVGMTLGYQEFVTGAAGRPTGQAGWIAWWRSGSGGLAVDGWRLLKL